MTAGMNEQKKAVESGAWPLYRYNPTLLKEGKNPLQLDSKAPTMPYRDFAFGENRFRTLRDKSPDVAEALMKQAEETVKRHFELYQKLAALQP